MIKKIIIDIHNVFELPMYEKIYRKVTRNSLKLTQPSVGMVRVQSLDYFTYSCGRSV